MVTQYGFSSKIGTVTLGGGDSEPFLGMTGAGGRSQDYSDQTAKIIDQEVADLLEAAHQEAFETLEANRDILDELVRQLFEKETLQRAEVAAIFTDLKRHPARGGFTGSDQRQPSTIPPITPPKSPAGELPGPEVGGVGPAPSGPTPPGWHPQPGQPGQPGTGGPIGGVVQPGPDLPGPELPAPGGNPWGPPPSDGPVR